MSLSYSAWIAPLKSEDSFQSKMLLQEQGQKGPALDMGVMKETQGQQLSASSLPSHFPVRACKFRQKALWGEQAAVYYFPQNTYSNTYQTILSRTRQH